MPWLDPTLSLGTVPKLCHPQSEEFPPPVEVELVVFYFMATAPRAIAEHHQKECGTILGDI